MTARLVALDEGPDILLDQTMIVVGRHPSCDARLASLRLSRRHCCLTQENGEIVVRDLGSTNGIRINGAKVKVGRLRVGDELSLAHLRYRVESDPDSGRFESRPDPPRPSVRRTPGRRPAFPSQSIPFYQPKLRPLPRVLSACSRERTTMRQRQAPSPGPPFARTAWGRQRSS